MGQEGLVDRGKVGLLFSFGFAYVSKFFEILLTLNEALMLFICLYIIEISPR